MFEITSEDTAQLSDADLRTLVGRLCEEEVRRRGFPASAVTWGGHQDAPDDGLDVRVALPTGTLIDGFIPRPSSGFQVKKPDLPRMKILAEMRPNGKLRRAIEELAAEEGAYIIVSGAASTTDGSLGRRRAAMAEAAGPLTGLLALDFYDRSRLATWVRDHPGLILWVREKMGKAIPGWQSYGPWAFSPEGQDSEYLFDDDLRIKTATIQGAAGMTTVEGIQRLRDVLREPRGVARIVGLSGVGKTRLVQALFDERIGPQPLGRSCVLYTNMGDEPSPQPAALAADLIATGTQATLVVDNCGADLHRRLAERCRMRESRLSLVTIEYDIREDEPEGTAVFKLEPSSAKLVEMLISRRFPTLSSIDARRAAEFSGGNAKIAFSLCDKIGTTETIARLTDAQLFHRLFRQGQEHDESLYLAAQACLPWSTPLRGDDTGESSRTWASVRPLWLVSVRSVCTSASQSCNVVTWPRSAESGTRCCRRP